MYFLPRLLPFALLTQLLFPAKTLVVTNTGIAFRF